MRQFLDPYTKRALEEGEGGELICLDGKDKKVYKCFDGCYDFSPIKSSTAETRNAYDSFYMKANTYKLTSADVRNPWFDETVPWRKTMLANLGPLSNKEVLLLGNGVSYQEFYFLLLGARVVFSDLSLSAVMRAKSIFRESDLWPEYRHRIEFHSVDATHLPFPDKSLDIIYGKKCVSFLPNLSQFFGEVKRCLKSGGICRFTDDAYSPAWEHVRELKHRIEKARKSLFPAPAKQTMGNVRDAAFFGFKEELVNPFTYQIGFRRLVFIREYFLLRVAQLIGAGIVGSDSKRLAFARPIFRAMKWIDNRIAKTKWMSRNALALTWGFDK